MLQVPVAIIIPFLTVGWQNFLSWQQTAYPFLSVFLFHGILSSIPPSPLHHRRVSGKEHLIIKQVGGLACHPLSVALRLVFHLVAQIPYSGGSIWGHVTFTLHQVCSANQGSSLPVVSWDPDQGAAAVTLAFHRKKSCFPRPEWGFVATQQTLQVGNALPGGPHPGLFLSFADQGILGPGGATWERGWRN